VLEPLCGYLKLAEKLYYDNTKKYTGSWNFGPNKRNNLKVKEIALIGKKILSSRSRIIIKKKKFYESENLSLDSSKSLKFLHWKTHMSDEKALKMTFDWFKFFYNKITRKNIIEFTFNQIKYFKKETNF